MNNATMHFSWFSYYDGKSESLFFSEASRLTKMYNKLQILNKVKIFPGKINI